MSHFDPAGPEGRAQRIHRDRFNHDVVVPTQYRRWTGSLNEFFVDPAKSERSRRAAASMTPQARSERAHRAAATKRARIGSS